MSRATKAWMLRIASFLAAALPPAIRALMLFPVWKESATVQVSAGLGAGGMIAAGICVWMLRETILRWLQTTVGAVRISVMAAIYAALVAVRFAMPYILKLEEVAFYALLGGLASWGLSALAARYD